MELPLDYPTLRLIWWALLGVLLIGFSLTDGYDLGVATLLPFVAKTDAERRLAINTIAPTWEGHQVWFILGGGAIFAAWPFVYAVSFSGFYYAMFIVLAALILRPVGFKYRSKRESKAWRGMWDWALFIGGFVPALIFGVAVGNVLQGVPFRLDGDLRSYYEGGLFGLLNPFALLAGLVSVSMLVTHGAAWLIVKAEKGPVRDRAAAIGQRTALATIILFVLAGVWLAVAGPGYRFAGEVDFAGPSNPLRNAVVAEPGAWLGNYKAYPLTMIAPVVGILGALLAFLGIRAKSEFPSLAGSALAIAGVISTVGLSMFPFILPSSLDPNSSLTVWDSSSSHFTLFFMLIVTVVFLPIVLLYTGWVFKVLWGRLSTEEATSPSSY